MIGFLRQLVFFHAQASMCLQAIWWRFCTGGSPTTTNERVLSNKSVTGNLDHVLDFDDLLFFCCLLPSFSALDFCVLVYLSLLVLCPLCLIVAFAFVASETVMRRVG
jgi:hypothetical protein